MDIYLFFLLLGFFGLLVMGASGLGAHGHAHSQGHGHGHLGHGHGGHDVGDISLHAGHAGPAHGGFGHAGHGPAHVGHAGAAGAHGHAGHGHAQHGHAQHHGDGHAKVEGGGALSWLTQFLNPRVAFSVFVGLGATGMLLRPYLGGLIAALIAVAGGIAFEKLMVAPLWGFLFRFASTPAHTLESSLMESATAVTGFDATGHGVVALELDGQIVQVLASLRPEDRAAGVRVRAGDRLMVEEVDGARNRCVVSWAGTSLPASS